MDGLFDVLKEEEVAGLRTIGGGIRRLRRLLLGLQLVLLPPLLRFCFDLGVLSLDPFLSYQVHTRGL